MLCEKKGKNIYENQSLLFYVFFLLDFCLNFILTDKNFIYILLYYTLFLHNTLLYISAL